MNVSKYKLTLTDDQTKVLGKGLNVAVTPAMLPVDEFGIATEQACRSPTITKSEQLRFQLAEILKTAKLLKSNINRKERQPLAEFKKYKTIIILLADKGKATVIMDTDEYEQKVTTALSDDKTYENMKTDPKSKYKGKLASIKTKLKEDAKIKEEWYKYLHPTASNVLRTLKILKPCNPVRPMWTIQD